MTRLDHDLDPPEVETDSRFGRRLAVAVAVVAVIASACAAGSAIADSSADIARRDAQQAAILALSERTDALAQLYDSRARAAQRDEIVSHQSTAEIEAILLGEADLPGEQAAWTEAADAWQKSEDLRNQGPAIPEGSTPDQLMAQVGDLFVEFDRATMLFDAARETSSGYAKKSDSFFVAVTLLAVVLTLLGLASGTAIGTRWWLLVPAAALFVGATGWAAVTAVIPVPTTPIEAINATVEGNRLARLYSFAEAVPKYDEALALRSDLTAALIGRAGAEVNARSKQIGNFIIAESTDAAWASSAADLRIAIDQGAEDVATYLNLGANLFHMRHYAESEQFSRRALALNQDLPLIRANIALAVAAQGRADEAVAGYREFLVAARAKTNGSERTELFSSSLTTLETLARLEPDRADLVVRLQGLLALTWAIGDYTETPAGAATVQLELEAEETTLDARIRYTGIEPNTGVSWVAYTRADGASDWIQRSDLSRFESWKSAVDGDAGMHWDDRLCMPAGEVRLDFFVGSTRVATASESRQGPTSGATEFYDARSNMAGCRPPTWTTAGQLPGDIEFTGPNGSSLAIRSLVLEPGQQPVVVRDVLDRVSAHDGVTESIEPTSEAMALIEGLSRREGSTQVWVGLLNNTLVAVTSIDDPADPTGTKALKDSLITLGLSPP